MEKLVSDEAKQKKFKLQVNKEIICDPSVQAIGKTDYFILHFFLIFKDTDAAYLLKLIPSTLHVVNKVLS